MVLPDGQFPTRAAALWSGAEVSVLEGGNAAWFAAQLPVETGIENSTTSADEVRYKPYDHARAQDYASSTRAPISAGKSRRWNRSSAIRLSGSGRMVEACTAVTSRLDPVSK